jgi:hypothetical protein
VANYQLVLQRLRLKLLANGPESSRMACYYARTRINVFTGYLRNPPSAGSGGFTSIANGSNTWPPLFPRSIFPKPHQPFAVTPRPLMARCVANHGGATEVGSFGASGIPSAANPLGTFLALLRRGQPIAATPRGKGVGTATCAPYRLIHLRPGNDYLPRHYPHAGFTFEGAGYFGYAWLRLRAVDRGSRRWAFCQVDPGKCRAFTPRPRPQIYELASDRRGHIWVTATDQRRPWFNDPVGRPNPRWALC